MYFYLHILYTVHCQTIPGLRERYLVLLLGRATTKESLFHTEGCRVTEYCAAGIKHPAHTSTGGYTDIPTGLHHGKAKMQNGVCHFLSKDRPKHHSTDHLQGESCAARWQVFHLQRVGTTCGQQDQHPILSISCYSPPPPPPLPLPQNVLPSSSSSSFPR